MGYMNTDKISKKVRLDKELDLFTRGPGDAGVVKEQRQCYRLMLEHDFRGGPMLDIGGHIGAFAQFIRQNPTVGHITSVEPDPNNIRVFKKNLSRLGDCKLVEAAVVPGLTESKAESVILYLGKNYPSCNSLEPFRGREEVAVAPVSWEQLLQEHPWTGIKCDIEGGEYLLDWTRIPDHVTMIAMEYHFQRPHWATLFRKIHRQLTKQNFFRTKKMPKVNTFSKVTIGIYAR